MFFFNKEDVYIGYSMEELSKVRRILEHNGIKYSYNVINRSGQWLAQGTMRGNFGNVGLNSQFEKQYVVFVKKKDSEDSVYWINSVLLPLEKYS
jgi:hypothetical protein